MQLIHLLAVGVFVAAQCELPGGHSDWKLSWGSVIGEVVANDVCVFRKIRYALPPTGERRFSAPVSPEGHGVLPDSPYEHPSCIQMQETECLAPHTPPLDCFGQYYGNQTEDCLFLDVYVPQSVLRERQKVPVAVWFYGGGFVFGSKSQYDPEILPFYDGTGFVYQSTKSNLDASMILVTGNYRLGAFGWLAGNSFKAQGGSPNTGLLDQRLMLQFVQKYISDINGDNTRVSVWGESAGASSIMHHIAMPQNIAMERPLFSKAIVQSPAYQWMWDGAEALDRTFADFSNGVNTFNGPGTDICGNQEPLECLRSNPAVTTEVLAAVNQNLFTEAACEGILPLGPSVDGDLIPTLAPLRYRDGQIMDLDSVIISHVALEMPYSNSTTTFSFLPYPVRQYNNASSFDEFLKVVFPGQQYQPVWDAVKSFYPSKAFKDEISRAQAVVTDSSFTCNTRFMIDGMLKKTPNVYAMEYALLMNYTVLGKTWTWDAATHASDLLPAWTHPHADYTEFFRCYAPDINALEAQVIAKVIQEDTGENMQDYFTAHATSGNPNDYWSSVIVEWKTAKIQPCPEPNDGSCVSNVMRPKTSFINNVWVDNDVLDVLTNSRTCKFWEMMAEWTMNIYNGRKEPSVEHPGAQITEQMVMKEL